MPRRKAGRFEGSTHRAMDTRFNREGAFVFPFFSKGSFARKIPDPQTSVLHGAARFHFADASIPKSPLAAVSGADADDRRSDPARLRRPESSLVRFTRPSLFLGAFFCPRSIPKGDFSRMGLRMACPSDEEPRPTGTFDTLEFTGLGFQGTDFQGAMLEERGRAAAKKIRSGQTSDRLSIRSPKAQSQDFGLGSARLGVAMSPESSDHPIRIIEGQLLYHARSSPDHHARFDIGIDLR